MRQKVLRNIKKFLEKCKMDNLTAFAAQAAFFIILSAIPFLMVFSLIIRYTPLTEDMLLDAVTLYIPKYLTPLLESVINEVYTQSASVISIAAIVAIWSAAKGLQYMGTGLNVVHECKETRNWFLLRFEAIGYTIVLILAILLLLVGLVFGNTLKDSVVEHFPLLEPLMSLFIGIRVVVIMTVLILFFAMVFKVLPNRKVTFKSQLPGAALTAASWYIFSFALSVYVDFFNGFSTYGRLATVVLMMFWLYFCMYLMLLGAEVNVVFNNLFRRWKRAWDTKKENHKK